MQIESILFPFLLCQNDIISVISIMNIINNVSSFLCFCFYSLEVTHHKQVNILPEDRSMQQRVCLGIMCMSSCNYVYVILVYIILVYVIL